MDVMQESTLCAHSLLSPPLPLKPLILQAESTTRGVPCSRQLNQNPIILLYIYDPNYIVPYKTGTLLCLLCCVQKWWHVRAFIQNHKESCITYGINVVSNMIIQWHDTGKEREKKIFHMKHYLLMPPNTTLTTYIYSITITNVSCNSKSLTLQSNYFPFYLLHIFILSHPLLCSILSSTV